MRRFKLPSAESARLLLKRAWLHHIPPFLDAKMRVLKVAPRAKGINLHAAGTRAAKMLLGKQ